jgi:hypothetical protein
MAENTPWQLAAKKPATYTKKSVYRYDPYNFDHMSVSNGTNSVVVIPMTGPHAAGAVPPNSFQQNVSVTIVASGTNQPVMGSNFQH